MSNTIQDNLIKIKKQISIYEKRCHRPLGSVSLLAASKSQPIEKIKCAIAAGQHAFGENYLQEAMPKMAALKDETLEWHFIGTMQGNKVRQIAENFAWVHSVQSKKTAEALNKSRPLSLPKLNVCLEVNIDQEENKSGATQVEILSLIQFCKTLPRLKVRGLMCIPARQKKMADQRVAFHALFALKQYLITQGFELDTLSMGMSEDFEAAILEGATIVRLGTALFGKRI